MSWVITQSPPLSSAPPDGGVQYQGELLNTNTIEDFKAKDYNALLNSAGEKVLVKP